MRAESCFELSLLLLTEIASFNKRKQNFSNVIYVESKTRLEHKIR